MRDLDAEVTLDVRGFASEGRGMLKICPCL